MNELPAVQAEVAMTTKRNLKIDEDGDPWKGPIKPKIRLIGRWLERAGFKPGSRVIVDCVAPGIIELHLQVPSVERRVDNSKST